MLATAPGLIARWAHIYGDTKSVGMVITWTHFAGILLGGGFAVVADRAGLGLSKKAPAEPKAVSAAVHRWVVAGLVLIFASGILMMLADLHTYFTSLVFWIKMGLVAALLINGYGRSRAETAHRDGAIHGRRRLRRTSIISLVLWFVILLVSTVLNSAA